jgi:hypothetical protein
MRAALLQPLGAGEVRRNLCCGAVEHGLVKKALELLWSSGLRATGTIQVRVVRIKEYCYMPPGWDDQTLIRLRSKPQQHPRAHSSYYYDKFQDRASQGSGKALISNPGAPPGVPEASTVRHHTNPPSHFAVHHLRADQPRNLTAGRQELLVINM